MIAIEINGVEYTNIASCTPAPIYDFYYDVTTLDGKRHREKRGHKVNYNIVFYNKDGKEYDDLKTLLYFADEVTLKVPTGADKFDYGRFLVTVNGDNLKGKLWNGEYYNTGLSVTFERVEYNV